VKIRRHVVTALLVGSMAAALVGCNSGSSTSATNPVDLSPPQAPTNLHASTDVATQREWLQWDPSASASVASYEIYVSDSPSGTGSLVSSVDANTNDFLLPVVTQTTTEYYRVRAIGTNDVPSAFTGTVSVDRTSFDGPQPTGTPGKGIDGDF